MIVFMNPPTRILVFLVRILIKFTCFIFALHKIYVASNNKVKMNLQVNHFKEELLLTLLKEIFIKLL